MPAPCLGDPFGVSVGSSPVRFNLGATVVNSLVLYPAVAVGHFLFTILVWHVRKAVLNNRATLLGSMGMTLFPSWGWSGQVTWAPVLVYLKSSITLFIN